MSQKSETAIRRTVRKNKTKLINEFVDLVKKQSFINRCRIAWDILTKRIEK